MATKTTSILTGGVNNHLTTSEEANYFATDFVTPGFIGSMTSTAGAAPTTGSYAPNAQGTPNMTIAVSPGVVYITTTPSGQATQILSTRMAASENVTHASNSSGSTKYDWVYITNNTTNAANPNVAGDNVSTFFVSRSTSNVTDNGTPPSNSQLIYIATVANGETGLTNAMIRDMRTQGKIAPPATSSTDYTALSGSFGPAVYNGNRSYTIPTSANLTGVLSRGARILSSRSTPAPTQSTSLNGTTQYWNDTSVSGMTFTDDFVTGAWVKPSSYTSGAIISCFNGTSGWSLKTTAAGTGQLELDIFNGGSGNFRFALSYQSLPLNKWTHVAVQMDASAYTATETTCYIMIDGVGVPISLGTGGTNPTALVQAGDLQIGAQNSALFFPGKIAQAFVSSAKITQANVRTLISQGLTSALISTHSIVSAYSFDGNANDLNTTNANNLTPQGSATATNADSPFGGQAGGTISSTLDCGIVQDVTASTLVVQMAEGCTIPTSGGVASFSYSNQKSPYGFPGETSKFAVESYYIARFTGAGGAVHTFLNLGHQITAPIGSWNAGYSFYALSAHAGVAYLGHFVTLSTANNTQSNKFATSASPVVSTAAVEIDCTHTKVGIPLSLSAATIHYFNIAPMTTGQNLFIGDASAVGQGGCIRLENAYV